MIACHRLRSRAARQGRRLEELSDSVKADLKYAEFAVRDQAVYEAMRRSLVSYPSDG